MVTSRPRFSWHRVVLIAVITGLAVAFVVFKPLLLPKPLPPDPPTRVSPEAIAYVDSMFQVYGMKTLYRKCTSRSDDALQLIVNPTLSNPVTFVLQGNRLIEQVVHVDRDKSQQQASVTSSFTVLNARDQHLIWQKIDRISSMRPAESTVMQWDGINLTLELCRHGRYNFSEAMERSEGPQENAVFDLVDELGKLTDYDPKLSGTGK